jgi:uncharacterized damage-inducible protein DinB
MSQVPKWYERKFDFSFPPELYPNICIRLRGTPARLEEMLQECPYEVLAQKREGKWSAQEHAGHLLDLEPLWLARVEDFVTRRPELTVADLSNRKTDEANHNARPTAEILIAFREARLKLLNRVRGLDTATFSRSLLHPRLKKPMRLLDHLYFIGEHDDHHLASIWELIG